MDYKKRDEYKKLISLCQSILILAIEVVAFGYVWFKIYDTSKAFDESFPGANNLVVFLYLFVLFFFTRLNGGYKFGHLRLMDLIFSQILSLLGSHILVFFVMSLALRRIIAPGPLVVLTLFDIIIIFIYNGLMHFMEVRLYPPRRLVLVYGDKGPYEMMDTFNAREDKFCIKESIHAGSNIDMIMKKAEEYDGIIIHRVQPELRSKLLHLCYQKDIRAYIAPYISDIILWSSGNTHLFDMPMLVTRNHGITVVEAFFKRLMDIVLSVIMFIILSPLMLIIALIVKLQDGGPVIYKQERVTKGGKLFYIYKFCSMRIDSETNGAKLARKNDERVTRFGAFLRAIHLDEMPQLINIIKGDMSLVGPRPERPEIIEKYKDEIPEFDYRLKVKAGLTGFAQVYGRYKTPSYNKLKLDLMYIEHYSIWLDIKIMLLTIKIIFNKENSEGI